MSEEETLQLKKDTLWEIDELKRTVACLEQKIRNYMQSLKEIYESWEDGVLDVSSGLLCKKISDVQNLQVIRFVPDKDEFCKTFQELKASKEKLEKLQSSFDQM